MSPGNPPTPRRKTVRILCWFLLVAGLVGIVPVQQRIDRRLEAGGRKVEALYFPSGALLRRMSLGHEGLLANIYWTRVVQYFGRRRLEQATHYELLGPLLGITTELDPHLIIAYRFGAVFLASKPPSGAGQPQQALQFLRRGIVANPEYWRLWQDLGFVYYWDLKDYDGAARVFRTGSERSGAHAWMKVLAATVAAEGGDIHNSRLLWSEIYRYADNDQIRKSAEEHLIALQAQEEMAALGRLLDQFRARSGRAVTSFEELVAVGALRAVPRDPTGAPYALGRDGSVRLSPQSKVDLRLLQ